MVAMLNLVKAIEYIRRRLHNRMAKGGWATPEVFGLVDRDHKGWFGPFDLEKLLKNEKRAGTQLSQDCEMVVSVFDRSGTRVVSLVDFARETQP